MIAAERTELLEFLRTLSAQDWLAPSLCERWRVRDALRNPNRFAHRRRITKGLKFIATDVDWISGTGPEVRGPGEALALAIVGRHTVLGELDGDGVVLPAQRIAQ